LPAFRYFCDDCNAEFEEILLQTQEIKEYFEWHPCPDCKGRAERIRINTFSFGFKSNLPVGNTGVHSVDYPMLDIAVGRSADKKRAEGMAKKKNRDDARRKLGTNYISQKADGEIRAVNPKLLENREKGLKLLDKGLKNLDKDSKK